MKTLLILSFLISFNVYGVTRQHTTASALPQKIYLSIPANTPGTILEVDGGVATCTRNSIATYTNVTGLLATASADQCRVSLEGGVSYIWSEEQRTNVFLYSKALGTALIPTGSAVFTNGYAPSPSGATDASRIQTLATTPATRSMGYVAITMSAATYSRSIYLRDTGGTLPFRQRPGGTLAPVNCAIGPIWSRCYGTYSAVAETEYIVLGPEFEDHIAIDALGWGVQTEIGAFATSYIPTAGTAVQRNKDEISSTIRNWNVGTNWSIEVTALPGFNRPVGTAYILAGGTDGAANTFNLKEDTFNLYDTTSGVYTITLPAITSAAHTFKIIGGDKPPILLIDGILSGTASGVGTGILSIAPTILYIGQKSNGSGQYNGGIRSIVIRRGE
jgi:hypothetical protein